MRLMLLSLWWIYFSLLGVLDVSFLMVPWYCTLLSLGIKFFLETSGSGNDDLISLRLKITINQAIQHTLKLCRLCHTSILMISLLPSILMSGIDCYFHLLHPELRVFLMRAAEQFWSSNTHFGISFWKLLTLKPDHDMKLPSWWFILKNGLLEYSNNAGSSLKFFWRGGAWLDFHTDLAMACWPSGKKIVGLPSFYFVL